MADSFSFKGKRAVVIAGTSGIGLASAKLFAALGGQVVIVSPTKEKVEAAVKEVGALATGEVVDATQEDQVKALFERIGEYDHLISSSGRGVDKPFLESSVQDLKATWEPKYWLYVNVSRYGAPKIRPGGSIILVSGTNGSKPGRNSTQAAAINAAVEGLGRALALDLSPIRVSVISPGAIATPLWEKFAPDPAARAAKFEDLRQKLPSQSVGTAEEVARLIIAVISSPFATGSTYHVNGGSLLI